MGFAAEPDIPPPDPDRPQCASGNLIATVEILGRDGGTSALYPGLNAPPDPEAPGGVAPPDPERLNFGIVGMTRGQTARLNLVYVPGLGDLPPGPCRVQLMFFDSDGHRIAASAVDLAPGLTAPPEPDMPAGR